MDPTLKALLKFIALYTLNTVVLLVIYFVFKINIPILLRPMDTIRIICTLGLILAILEKVLFNKLRGE